jgi:hypothetical protein
VDFTREPIIETIITPKEGYKLVIRSSTSAGQEEYFVDAVEIVAFGHALFFRSLERPKAFLVPVSDYEVLEVREARMVLKNAGLDRSIKIGGGREGVPKVAREAEKGESVPTEDAEGNLEEVLVEAPATAEARPEIRVDKKRDRRRHYRKRKGRDEREEGVKEEGVEPVLPPLEDEKIVIPPPEKDAEVVQEGAPLPSTLFSSLLQPPPTLISETINRYRQNELFKGAFYLTEEEQYKPHDKVQELLNEEDEEEVPPSLQEPTFEKEEQVSESLNLELEAEKSEELTEETQSLEEQPNLFIENQKEEEKSSLFFEEEEEEEHESGLSLYSEEEMTVFTESPYSPEEVEEVEKTEEEPTQENHPTSHNEQTT